MKEKDEAIQRQCTLEKKIHELEKQGTIKIQKKGDGDIAILTSAPSMNGLLAGTEGVTGVPKGAMVGLVGPSNGVEQGMPMPPPPPPPPPMPTICESLRCTSVLSQIVKLSANASKLSYPVKCSVV